MTIKLKILNELIDELTEKVQALIKENQQLKTELMRHKSTGNLYEGVRND